LGPNLASRAAASTPDKPAIPVVSSSGSSHQGRGVESIGISLVPGQFCAASARLPNNTNSMTSMNFRSMPSPHALLFDEYMPRQIFTG
jgi:hypothetical protein